ncbi:hypothetical protein [Microbacterium sp.]
MTVTTCAAILPFLNLFIPVFAWLAASVNLLGLFGERVTPEEVAEQL